MDTIKIVTFNLHHGKENDVKYSKEKLLDDISSLNGDIICLQEVDKYSIRTKFNNQAKLIANHLGYFVHSSFVRFFGLGFQYNIILSKFPIEVIKEIVLPNIKGKQRRLATKVKITTDNGPLVLINSHLTSGDIVSGNSIAQTQLKFLLENNSEDIFIIGDLNMLALQVLPNIEKFGFKTLSGYKTSPANNPKNQIDWILTRGYKLNSMRTSEKLCSDHRALIAIINL